MSFFERAVRPDIPSEFFSLIPERVDAAFASAHRRSVTEGNSLPEHAPYARGSDRHYAVQRAFVETAVALGGEKFIVRAGSSKYPLVFVRMGKTIIGIAVKKSLNDLERSKAKRELSSLNSFLDPVQSSFWEEEIRPSLDDFRFALILVAKPRRTESQVLPSGIYFGVPSTSLKSWHLYKSMDDIRGLYEEADWAETPPPVERRQPRLRKTSQHEDYEEGTGT